MWKTPDINPDALIGFACYRNLELVENNIYLQNGAVKPDREWAYVKDIIAAADKAERLEEENEAMREEFEVWHGNYMCVVEDKERLEQAVQYLKRLHIATIEKYNPKEKELAEQTIDYAIEMAIEQEVLKSEKTVIQ